MLILVLTNSSTYEQRFVNADDYRTQEFPNGTQTTITVLTKKFFILTEQEHHLMEHLLIHQVL